MQENNTDLREAKLLGGDEVTYAVRTHGKRKILKRLGLAALLAVLTNNAVCTRVLPFELGHYLPTWTCEQHPLGRILGIEIKDDIYGISREKGRYEKITVLEHLKQSPGSTEYHWGPVLPF